MKNVKYVRISPKDIDGILIACKTLSESLEKPNIIIGQFNSLTPSQRTAIKNEWSKREAILKSKVEHNHNNNDDMYLTCIMVNLNIIATKYNIDPATVCMCINPPCKDNCKILVK
ncbi:hypothetical protein [Clostridium beijerinckii]|uniref:Uncharacterized protein n=1 Tax=Clostridium beijerinckii TaxID=1520 RepID=A0A0B5QC99_CLOBE|nr:hypothetical protein [Clostridium beijerinckii]AJG98565.1 hypothetical protein LF65_01967 [Clostridium beijerinckii]ALB46966.1 hypothetical protein X276_17815 [Clostridium beijerinckii NRRL B-598]